jgi:hypothetical protein
LNPTAHDGKCEAEEKWHFSVVDVAIENRMTFKAQTNLHCLQN